MKSPQIPWLRVFVEGVVIVGSILLAFGIQAWWEARGDSLSREALRQALQNDMTLASMEVGRVMGLHEQGRDAAAALLNLRASAPLSGGEAYMVDSLMWATIVSPSYDAPLGAVEALLGSGDIDLLDDPDLASELTAFPSLVADLDREQTLLIQLVDRLSGYLWGQGVDTSDLQDGAPWETRSTEAFSLIDEAEFRGIMSVLWARYRKTPQQTWTHLDKQSSASEADLAKKVGARPMPTRSIPWPRILAEGFAIVVSILLAFGIQAWWEGVQERQAEQIALEALREEFVANLATFEGAHVVHERLAHDTSRLLDNLLEAPIGSRIEVVDSLLVPLVAFMTVEAATGTLTTLLASGQIDLIRDQELQQSLAAWPAALANTAEDEVGVREFVLGQLIPGLAGHADLSGVLAARTSSGMMSGRSFSLTGRSYGVQVSPITRTLIGERHLVAQGLLRGSNFRRAQAEGILDLIDRQLAR